LSAVYRFVIGVSRKSSRPTGGATSSIFRLFPCFSSPRLLAVLSCSRKKKFRREETFRQFGHFSRSAQYDCFAANLDPITTAQQAHTIEMIHMCGCIA